MRRRLPSRRRGHVAGFVVLTLVAGLLHGGAARAADPLPAPDRWPVVQAWQYGQAQVRAAAERALVGGDDEVRAFLNGGWQDAQRLDERDAVLAVIADGGPATRTAGRLALDAAGAGDQSAPRRFLQDGWRQPADTDARVRVNQLMAAGGDQVKAAAQQALDSADPAVWRQFADSGWQSRWIVDQRLRVNQAMSGGGPEVRAAGQKALDAGTPEALESFLDYGWGVAAARDQETETLTGLLAQAQAQGDVAAQETQRALDEAAKAKEAAEAARLAAEEAARATEAARDDVAQAAAQAQRAALAAQKAAESAKAAVGAAASANRAARAAASAAQRAASAASRADRAATKAYNAAAFAAIDASTASAARITAQEALDNARQSRDFATIADLAGKAMQAGQGAIGAALSAVDNAKKAAKANDEAVLAANAAGADASAAIRAANQARAGAERAQRAANAAQNYLVVAANAAFAARDAANRAAGHAEAAARAAIDAADHAGDAVAAAQRATEAAQAATEAAQAAVDTANQAAAVYDAARAADAERIAVARDEGIETARAATARYEQEQQAARWDAVQAEQRDAETDRLLAEARNPATDPATAVADGRRVAMNLTRSRGAWTRQAALAALAGTDAQVLLYAREGVPAAAGQDDRVIVRDIAITPNTKLRDAALAALNGSDAAVAQFMRTQSYPGRAADDRVKVNQVLAAARTAGDVVLQQKAQEALDSGDARTLRLFLDTGQYTAAEAGQRVRVNQILAGPNSGAEVKAAAQIALDGPPPGLRQFLDVGQYAAAERDQDAAAHLATVAGLMQQINQVAQTALHNALDAQAAAARARGDAAKAADYANRAAQSAQAAAGYAAQAQQYADQAVQSVDKAAAAVRTAKEAATRANASARSAIRSAAWAVASHETAVRAATEAQASAQRAHDSAVAAGHDAWDAAVAGYAARDLFVQAQGLEIGKCHTEYAMGPAPDLEKLLGSTPGSWYENCARNAIGNPRELATRAHVNSTFCAAYPDGSQLYHNCLLSVLDPAFRDTEPLVFVTEVLKGITAELLPIAGAFAGACIATIICGLVLSSLLSLTEAGLEIYKLIKGDQSLADTLLHLGTQAAESLLMAGLAKLVGAGFRTLKELYLLNKAAKAAETEVSLLNVAVGKLKRLSACLTGNSFTPDTPVLLADHTTERIADIRVGDRVLATDPATGATTAEPVTGLLASTDTELTDVTVERPAGERGVLHTTAYHPFWAAGGRQWTDASRLSDGTALSAPGGGTARVTSVRTYAGRRVMYNLTVASRHTYYVVVAGTAVLVHNATPRCDHLALGLNHPGAGMGSDALAQHLSTDELKVITYNGAEWGKMDPDSNGLLAKWVILVSAAIKDPTVQLYVTLDGLDGVTAIEKFRTAARRGSRMTQEDAMRADGTNWEMALIAKMFYLGGEGGVLRDAGSVHWYLNNGVDVSDEIRSQLPTTVEGWLQFMTG